MWSELFWGFLAGFIFQSLMKEHEKREAQKFEKEQKKED